MVERVRRLPVPQVTSPLRDSRVAARVGLALGVLLAVCFLTGLVSHFHQHPVRWLPLPASPVWGYRVTQGLHVACGLACIPLVLVKLFSVYPKLLEWPPVRSLPHLLERASVGVLVAGTLFELASGVCNIAQWYPFGFFFPAAHYAVAWALVGAVLLHVALKAPLIAQALRSPLKGEPATGLTRRGLLVATGASAATLTVVTVGQTLPALTPLTLLAPRRPDLGPQGLPVNRTAGEAGVSELATDPDWMLSIRGLRPIQLTLADLRQLPQHEYELPIACVEGWSASAMWRGVRLADLLDLAGIDRSSDVRVRSLQPAGLYRSAVLRPALARHRTTLVALQLSGEPLVLDHGAPARLIAPNLPGVLQTKWLGQIEPA